MENQTMLTKGSIFPPKREPAPAPATTIKAPMPGAAPSPAAMPAPPEPAPASNLQSRLDAAGREPVAGARLTVGPGVKLKGAEIQDCDTLVVEGRVDATMNSRFIEIAENGSFDGKVNIDVAEIRGRFAGELTAREHIVIHATGCVSGKIRYGRIVIHEGGELSGDVRSLTAESAGGETGDGAARLAVKTA
jgi:cytoskeletal protein CcmA (bactofilin family)